LNPGRSARKEAWGRGGRLGGIDIVHPAVERADGDQPDPDHLATGEQVGQVTACSYLVGFQSRFDTREGQNRHGARCHADHAREDDIAGRIRGHGIRGGHQSGADIDPFAGRIDHSFHLLAGLDQVGDQHSRDSQLRPDGGRSPVVELHERALLDHPRHDAGLGRQVYRVASAGHDPRGHSETHGV
jgi:hypothetical protein